MGGGEGSLWVSVWRMEGSYVGAAVYEISFANQSNDSIPNGGKLSVPSNAAARGPVCEEDSTVGFSDSIIRVVVTILETIVGELCDGVGV